MRQFNEYLSTKVNLYNKFPTEPNIKEITAFLRYHDFKELKFDDNKFYVNILEENNDSKRFMLNSYHKDDSNWTWIRFIDAGDICKENPSFYITFSNDKIYYMRKEFSLPSGEGYKYDKYEDFVEAVKSFFNWK